ncbi:MAG: hypothetical protein R2704_14860 [Microthrixaceae bacterium]
MTPPEVAAPPEDDPARLRAMRLSMGMLWAAGAVVMAGFLTTQWLSDTSSRRLGSPSEDAVARERVPSSEAVSIDEPGTYDLYYEQDAPSVGVPRRLEVTIASEDGELSLDTPNPSFSTVIDERSYVTFRTVTIPRPGTYTLGISLRGAEGAAASLEDDRVVLDRADRSADALWVLFGLTPAAGGMALAACLVAASVWLRSRALRPRPSASASARAGPAAGGWGPPTGHPFRDAPPPPDPPPDDARPPADDD